MFYLWLIHTAVWQKPIQYCIVIILQLKKKGNIGVLLLMRKGKEHAISSQLLSGETRIWSPHCLTSTSIFFYSCCLVTKSYLTLCNLMDYTASQAPLSSTISWSSLKFKSIKLVMLSNQLILCHPLLLLPSIFTSIRVFSSDWLFTSGGQSIEASASVSVLPMNV